MQTLKLTLAAFCAVLLSTGAFAQVTTSHSSDQLTKDINELGNQIHDLFGHKKKKPTGNPSDTKDKKGDVANSTNSNNASSSSTAAKSALPTKLNPLLLKGGDIAPGAKYLDVDYMYPFNGGSAVVEKGETYALINSKGHLIVPFNTYAFLRLGEPGTRYIDYDGNYEQLYFNGFYEVSPLASNGDFQGGYINGQGKIISKDQSASKNCKYLEDMLIDGSNFVYTDSSGKQYKIGKGNYAINVSSGYSEINNNIVVMALGDRSKYAYMKLTGKWITNFDFDAAYTFSEGMAVVGKINQFGEMKYGFIDTSGKLIIPLMFSNKPSAFYCGYAKVEPRNKNEFEYAFINKKGKIVFKQTLADVEKYGTFGNFRNYGLSFSKGYSYVLDTNFKIQSKTDFFESYGAPGTSEIHSPIFTSTKIYSVIGETNPKIYFTNPAKGNLVGFINLSTRKVVMPVFGFISYFDPVSHLAYATMDMGRDIHNYPVYRQGFINEDGQWVLIKGQGSKW